ncbi:hypothetical protein LCGC14_0406050 [marine sediment metagenome]|uniref:Uncharacterized protein n=1 Tax=marine sediment metagenome TaxID=412755 RepID=A0A0F9VHB8_9ZZZZ
MIDEQGYCRCDGCNKKLGRFTVNLDFETVCPRSTCKRFNIFKRSKMLEAITKIMKSTL